jgi:hypothetical protein
MFYITKRDSETGIKFQELDNKRIVMYSQMDELQKQVKADSYYTSSSHAFGAIVSFVFEKEPDLKIWKYSKKDNDYTPRASSKEGKSIKEKMKLIEFISKKELNSCLTDKLLFAKTVGFNWSNADYFGISIREDWCIEMPNDCEEVTTTKYNEMFTR